MTVAAFVVALVGATLALWSAWSAHRSAMEARLTREEARQARLDALAPAVNVVGATGRRERWQAARFYGQEPGVVAPDVEYVMPRNADDVILLGAELLMTNEGSTTAILSLPDHSEFVHGVGGFPDHFEPGENAEVPPSAGERQFALSPGRKALLLLRAGHAIRTWAAGAPTARAELRVRSQFGQGVLDVVTVDLSGTVIEPVHGDDSHFRVVPHTPIHPTITTTRTYGSS